MKENELVGVVGEGLETEFEPVSPKRYAGSTGL